jgi:hypothetical protein
MTATFQEFLRQEAAKREAVLSANRAVIEEWRGALQALFEQLTRWLTESDSDRHVQIRTFDKKVVEPGLGEYVVPAMDLHILGTWIGILPKARKTVGSATPPQKTSPERAAGRVDITDEQRRYILYRFREADHDLWLIDDLRSPPKPLDQTTFEAALMSYLQ